VDASLEEIKENMKANQAKTDAHTEGDWEHMQQMKTKIQTDWGEMMARIMPTRKGWMQVWEKKFNLAKWKWDP
jgi:hypothetical protein